MIDTKRSEEMMESEVYQEKLLLDYLTADSHFSFKELLATCPSRTKLHQMINRGGG